MRTNVHARCSPSREIVPKRRPPRPQQPIFGMFCRGGLRFGHNILRSRSPRRENGDTRILTRQKNAPHAAKPLRLSCGSTVNTTTRTQRSPNTFCPSSLLVAHAAHVTTTRTQRRRRRCTSGTSDITRRTRRLTESSRCNSAPASSKYEVGAESWAAREPSRAQRGVVLPGSAYPGEGSATGLPEWGRTSAVTATKTSTAR